ncbi:hypothetical protein ACTFIZ_007609 [Dictyostelium cf. discoideum]
MSKHTKSNFFKHLRDAALLFIGKTTDTNTLENIIVDFTEIYKQSNVTPLEKLTHFPKSKFINLEQLIHKFLVVKSGVANVSEPELVRIYNESLPSSFRFEMERQNVKTINDAIELSRKIEIAYVNKEGKSLFNGQIVNSNFSNYNLKFNNNNNNNFNNNNNNFNNNYNFNNNNNNNFNNNNYNNNNKNNFNNNFQNNNNFNNINNKNNKSINKIYRSNCNFNNKFRNNSDFNNNICNRINQNDYKNINNKNNNKLEQQVKSLQNQLKDQSQQLVNCKKECLPYIDRIVSINMVDISIFSNYENEQCDHLKMVLDIISSAHKEYILGKDSVSLLDFDLTINGITFDQNEFVKLWNSKSIINKIEISRFLIYANYFSSFINHNN